VRPIKALPINFPLRPLPILCAKIEPNVPPTFPPVIAPKPAPKAPLSNPLPNFNPPSKVPSLSKLLRTPPIPELSVPKPLVN